MHEQRLVADLIKRATEVAAEHHAEHLSVMTVRVGALSHVAAGSIAAQIRQSAIGTPVENADRRGDGAGRAGRRRRRAC